MNTPYGRGEQALAWTLVAIQAVLLAGLVALAGERAWPTPWWLATLAVVLILVALPLAVAGALRLGAGLTASPLPSHAARLRTTGAYACVRHPIYAGLLLGGAGLVILGGRPARVVVWLGLLALLWARTVLEERKLSERFTDYRAYAARTPRLLPNPLRCATRIRAARS